MTDRPTIVLIDPGLDGNAAAIFANTSFYVGCNSKGAQVILEDRFLIFDPEVPGVVELQLSAHDAAALGRALSAAAKRAKRGWEEPPRDERRSPLRLVPDRGRERDPRSL